MAYAILRIAKHSTDGTLTAMTKHNKREMKVPNADPERTKTNVELVGSGDYTKDVNSIIKSENLHTQKNSVKAIEHIMTATPSFFQYTKREREIKDAKERMTARNHRFRNWVIANRKFLEEFYGPQSKIASMSLHLDESTPHIHAFIVPITEGKLKGGKTIKRLSAKAFVGDDKKLKPGQEKIRSGREKLRTMQDLYAEKMSEFGLERGIKGSQAQHLSVRRLYAEINNHEENLRIPSVEFPELEQPSGIKRLNPNKHYQEEFERIKDSIHLQIEEENSRIAEFMLAKSSLNASEALKARKLANIKEQHEKELRKLKKSQKSEVDRLKTERDTQEKKSLNAMISLSQSQEKNRTLSKEYKELKEKHSKRLVNLEARESQLRRAILGELDPAEIQELKQLFGDLDRNRKRQERRNNNDFGMGMG